MSPSSEPTNEYPTFVPAEKVPDLDAPDFDVRAASAARLVRSAVFLDAAITAANILDPRVPALIRRAYSIRQELGRRDVLLLQGSWATVEPTDLPARTVGQPWLSAIKTRNGRGGPGGPGDWDD